MIRSAFLPAIFTQSSGLVVLGKSSFSQNSSRTAERRSLPGAILIASPCPVCREHPLQGRQTACSAACRRERSRRREAEARQHREDELRVLALAARQAIEALERRLADAK